MMRGFFNSVSRGELNGGNHYSGVGDTFTIFQRAGMTGDVSADRQACPDRKKTRFVDPAIDDIVKNTLMTIGMSQGPATRAVAASVATARAPQAAVVRYCRLIDVMARRIR
jgi:hypothetical protein